MSKRPVKLYEVEVVVRYYELDGNGSRYEQMPTMSIQQSPTTYQVRQFFPDGPLSAATFNNLQEALRYYHEQLEGIEEEN